MTFLRQVIPLLAVAMIALVIGACTGGSDPRVSGDGAACATSADCASGEACVSGVCTAGTGADCNSNGDCGANESCIDALCIALADCTSNGDCATGESCIAGVCVSSNGTSDGTTTVISDCGTVGICPAGTTCENGECVADSCATDADCLASQTCIDSLCTTVVPTPTIEVRSVEARSPYVLRFVLRLEDADQTPVISGIGDQSFAISEDGRLLDASESSQFVTPGENIPLRIFLVLDYSNSMYASGVLEAMVAAAQAFVQADFFNASHEIGIIECHDRTDDGFGVELPLTRAARNSTDGQAAIAEAIPGPDDLEHGLSRIWDAVTLALDELAIITPQDGEVRAVVFLTDGLDTTSTVTLAELSAQAAAEGVVLYPLGFDLSTADAAALSNAAEATGGRLYEAAALADLSDVFAAVVETLRGQWILTYTTQKNSGAVATTIDWTYEGDTSTATYEFDAGTLAGDVYEGVLEVVDRWYDATADETSFLVRAAYVPRNISRLRLRVAQPDAALSLQGDGGLMPPDAGWTLNRDSDGFFNIQGPAPLRYGAFGNIGVVSTPGDVTSLQMSSDNSIYADLPTPKSFRVEGDAFSAPYMLTAVVEPAEGGRVVFNPPGGQYAAGEVVTVTAISTASYVFDAWADDAAGEDNVTTVVMDADKTVTAAFHEPHTLTVEVSPTVGGVVDIAPALDVYPHGSQVTLVADASAPFTFVSWEGAVAATTQSVTLTMDGDKSITAVFDADLTLGTVAIPTGYGSVTVTPAQTTYNYGDTVTLTAVPAAGRRFTGWSGAASGVAATTTVTITESTTAIAEFE